MTANVTNRESFHLEHRLITPSTETNPAQDPDVPRSDLNRDIWFSEIHDVFLDRTISPARTSDEPYSTSFRQVAWSPLGLFNDANCILAAVTADHRVVLYGNGRWMWQELDQPSAHWADYLRSRQWADVYHDENHSEIFSKFKNRSYMLATMAIDWSPIYESSGSSKWAWLICLQRSGHLVLWKVQAPFQQVKFEAFYDLQIQTPSALKVFPHHTGHLLVFSGTHQGIVKCHRLSWDSIASSDVKFHHLGHVISEADGMIVGAMDMYSTNNHALDVVICAKNNFVLLFTIRIDPEIDAADKALQVLDQRHVTIQGLSISGLCVLDGGRIICSLEDYQICEISADVDVKSGRFQSSSTSGLTMKRFSIPANPTMLCRSVSVSRAHPEMALFVLESLRVPHDHLQCRHPSNFVVYVLDDPHRILKSLKNVEAPNLALVVLESYKAHMGTNWDQIWEPNVKDWSQESVSRLQLIRWLYLYKSLAAGDPDIKNELKSKAQIAEYWLRLRYLETSFEQLDNQKEALNDDQFLVVHLACQFMTITLSSVSIELKTSFPYNRELVDKIREKYLSSRTPPEEQCGICHLKIDFENLNHGKCSNGHQAGRCPASFRLCFGCTLKCRWCGVHYRQDPALQTFHRCILCGGSTRNV